MVINADIEGAEQLGQFARRFDVRLAWHGIAAGMVMGQHYGMPVMGKGVADDLSQRQDDPVLAALRFAERNQTTSGIKMGNDSMFMAMINDERREEAGIDTSIGQERPTSSHALPPNIQSVNAFP